MCRTAPMFLLILVAAVSGAALAAADTVTIERAVSKTIKMYETPDGKGGRKGTFSKKEVNDFIDSQPDKKLNAIKDGLMLNVTINRKTGWIEARTVKLSGTSGNLKFRCAQASAPPSLAATRGVGNSVTCK
jgi:hypothetical protein